MKVRLPVAAVPPLVCTVIVCAASFAVAAGQEETPRRFGDLDVGRIEELYHLSDLLGDSLWPGFDVRGIPLAVNNQDLQELLVGHPDPPPEFKPADGLRLEGRPVLVREGSTQFGPSGGGWAMQLGGAHTAYVNTLQPDETTEDYLSLLMHECFHVYQNIYRESSEGSLVQLPQLDADYSALLCLESRVLHALLTGAGDNDAVELAKMFVAVRHERHRRLSDAVVYTEGEEEFAEGTATYIQARLCQVLAREGGVEPLRQGRDPHYSGFEDAAASYARFLDMILPPADMVITFLHTKYHVGMAQCLVLDRLVPGWKEAMRRRGATQFSILEGAFPLGEGEDAALVAAAKTRFGYDELLAAQSRLVGEQVATLRAYLEAPGRRYRVYYWEIPGSFRWKPAGPVHTVPNWLMEEIDEKLEPDSLRQGPKITSNVGPMIWEGGIPRFEKGDLVFESRQVPIIFRYDYFEWIDPDPANDYSDITFEWGRRDGDVYQDLRLETKGFVLLVPSARIVKSNDVFAIHPLPGTE